MWSERNKMQKKNEENLKQNWIKEFGFASKCFNELSNKRIAKKFVEKNDDEDKKI